MVNHAEGVGVRLLNVARQVWCGVHGHDSLLQFERDRMFLRCVSCGHETPGWEINDAVTPIAASQTDLRAQPVLERQLISVRRVA
jgi:hypothetical protein